MLLPTTTDSDFNDYCSLQTAVSDLTLISPKCGKLKPFDCLSA